MEIDKTAPILLNEHVTINAPVEKVWQLLADIPGWPQWNKNITAATLGGPLQPGTTFTWKAGPGSITSTLKAVETNVLIGWTGSSMGVHVVHLWRFESNGTGTVVTTEESARGLLAHLLPGFTRKMLTKALTDALQQLQAAAEK